MSPNFTQMTTLELEKFIDDHLDPEHYESRTAALMEHSKRVENDPNTVTEQYPNFDGLKARVEAVIQQS